jgi:hypothetical protein
MTVETVSGRIPDWRHIGNGWPIPTENYCDQPYVVKTDDGAWLCTVTTGGGREGQSGQHVVSMRSTDFGRTWSPVVPVEPVGPALPVMPVFCFLCVRHSFKFYSFDLSGTLASDTSGLLVPFMIL